MSLKFSELFESIDNVVSAGKEIDQTAAETLAIALDVDASDISRLADSTSFAVVKALKGNEEAWRIVADQQNIGAVLDLILNEVSLRVGLVCDADETASKSSIDSSEGSQKVLTKEEEQGIQREVAQASVKNRTKVRNKILCRFQEAGYDINIQKISALTSKDNGAFKEVKKQIKLESDEYKKLRDQVLKEYGKAIYEYIKKASDPEDESKRRLEMGQKYGITGNFVGHICMLGDNDWVDVRVQKMQKGRGIPKKKAEK